MKKGDVNGKVDSDSHAADSDAVLLADAVYDRLQEDPAAALALAHSENAKLREHPAVWLACAMATRAVEGEEAASRVLEALVARHPDDADARHALAHAYEHLGEHAAMVEQYLEVRRLDMATDARHGFEPDAAAKAILETAKHVMEDLPGAFRERLDRVPIVIEARPSIDLVRDGLDPRSLGLFEGPDHREPLWDVTSLPPRIVLYSANLTADLDPDDPDALAREVEITVLHEVGHYFGLDEDGVEALGLG